MNKTFAEYATSTAFCIQLSKNQCNALLRLEDFAPPIDSPHTFLLQVGTLQTLEARGLVWWKRDETGRANGFQGLTDAGRLMVALLKQADLTVETTNSVSMLRRMGRSAVTA